MVSVATGHSTGLIRIPIEIVWDAGYGPQTPFLGKRLTFINSNKLIFFSFSLKPPI